MLYGSRVNLADKNDPLTMIVGMVREGSRVLDVGCGVGNLAAFLSETKKCEVTAVEVFPVMAEMAKPYCRRMIVGSIEEAGTIQQVLKHGPYNYIIFADVLEHLADPWVVLRAMHRALVPEGRILLSLPNVAHWSIRLRLAAGKFDYTEGFLLDRSHLRFFTFASARQLIRQCGYEIETEMVRWAALPGDRVWRRVPVVRNAVNEMLARLFPGFYGYQFVYSLGEGKG